MACDSSRVRLLRVLRDMALPPPFVKLFGWGGTNLRKVLGFFQTGGYSFSIRRECKTDSQFFANSASIDATIGSPSRVRLVSIHCFRHRNVQEIGAVRRDFTGRTGIVVRDWPSACDASQQGSFNMGCQVVNMDARDEVVAAAHQAKTSFLHADVDSPSGTVDCSGAENHRGPRSCADRDLGCESLLLAGMPGRRRCGCIYVLLVAVYSGGGEINDSRGPVTQGLRDGFGIVFVDWRNGVQNQGFAGNEVQRERLAYVKFYGLQTPESTGGDPGGAMCR